MEGDCKEDELCEAVIGSGVSICIKPSMLTDDDYLEITDTDIL